MDKITEQQGHHRNLEKLETGDLLRRINEEDQKVAHAVEELIPALIPMVDKIADQLGQGGRLFYLGAGTSGRLGILDASECPPTFGVPHNLVIGLIAGGDGAIRKAVEFAEDDREGGWNDLQEYLADKGDFVIGIAASGTTPYVVGALEKCRENGIPTGCITCNPGAPITEFADYPLVAVVGPEIVTGSTRMKSGTAQKLLLNMISTSVMIKLGRVEDNRMVDMQLSNQKLIERGTRMLVDSLGIDSDQAKHLLLKAGGVREAVRQYRSAT